MSDEDKDVFRKSMPVYRQATHIQHWAPHFPVLFCQSYLLHLQAVMNAHSTRCRPSLLPTGVKLDNNSDQSNWKKNKITCKSRNKTSWNCVGNVEHDS